MGCVLSHVLRGLVVVLGLSVVAQSAHAQAASSITYADEGAAYAGCMAAYNAAVGYISPMGDSGFNSQWRYDPHPTPCVLYKPWVASQPNTAGFWAVCRAVRHQPGSSLDGQVISQNARCLPQPGAYTLSGAGHMFPPASSCASRPLGYFADPGDDSGTVCSNGCRYTIVLGGDFANEYFPDGATCSAGEATPQDPQLPEPPDADGDGVPDDDDDAPNDPNCSVNCGGPDDPDPPDEEDPPTDDRDDGEQVANALGPKLDKIEQAVLGLGPKVDSVRQAVESARADANADADRMVSAIDEVAAAVRAQGPNAQGDSGEDEPVDLSPLTPGADGGPHPGLSSIVETGDGQAMLAQLDTDGWSLTRSCPAYAWPLAFNLGWGTIDISEAVELVCSAMAILGWVIGLAGLIQASFILSRVGGGS